MAKQNGSNGSTATMDTARAAYIESLQTAHRNGLAEIAQAREQAEGLNQTIATRAAAVRETTAQLRQLGVEVADVDLPRAARATGTGRRGRPAGSRASNGQGLEPTILRFMNSVRMGTKFTIGEVITGITKGGYETKSENFNVIVNQALGRLRDSKSVARPERGTYVLTERGRVAAKASVRAAEAAPAAA